MTLEPNVLLPPELTLGEAVLYVLKYEICGGKIRIFHILWLKMAQNV